MKIKRTEQTDFERRLERPRERFLVGRTNENQENRKVLSEDLKNRGRCFSAYKPTASIRSAATHATQANGHNEHVQCCLNMQIFQERCCDSEQMA